MTESYHKSDEGSSWPVPATGCRALHVDHVQAAESASNDDNSCTFSSQKDGIDRTKTSKHWDYLKKILHLNGKTFSI